MGNSAAVAVTPVVDEGLGNSSYLLDLGDGDALAVDPPRDLRAVRAAAAGLRVRFVADTHLHADFLSGAVQLAHDDGAEVLASLAGKRRFPHRGLVDGDEVELGGLTLTVMATPGHTDEHLAFVLSGGGAPLGVFTGGSLIVGSAARTDLLGAERAEKLARAQYRSLQRLAELPPETAVWPTHGAGSFCSGPPAAERVSTIGRELATNPLLAAPDAEVFVRELLGSLGSYPPYFLGLADANRRGPAVVESDGAELAALPVPAVHRIRAGGGLVVDVRPVVDYAAAHVLWALSIPLRPQFATWLGWLVPPDRPVVIVRDERQDVEEIVWQAFKIGYEHVIGEVAGGMDAWAASGCATASTPLVPPDRAGRPLLDVRQLMEFVAGHLPGARHIELGSLTAAAAGIPDDPLFVMCGHGDRAAAAASILERAGRRNVTIVAGGGAVEWARATGRELKVGA